MAAVDPPRAMMLPLNEDLSVKLVVSTTSVSLSHRPRESPSQTPHALREMRSAVERHHARFVDHLGVNDHVVAGLQDLQVVVVGVRQDRRS